MTIDRPATRVVVALVALLLAAGTAIAADPSPSASPASHAPESSEPSESPQASESPRAAETAEPSESPEASESPEPSESPEASESPKAAAQAADAAPSAAELTRVVDRLKAAGIATTTAELSALAAKVGLGGAVRVLAFAHASGKTADQILAMFQGGMGWGEIDHQLGLSIGPGIGWIMGNGGGHGNGHGAKPSHGPKP